MSRRTTGTSASRAGRMRMSMSEGRDRNAGAAQRTIGRRKVLRRPVFRERIVLHVQSGDRLHPVVDLGGGNHDAAAGANELGAADERLAGVPHVVHEEHLLAMDLPL